MTKFLALVFIFGLAAAPQAFSDSVSIDNELFLQELQFKKTEYSLAVEWPYSPRTGRNKFLLKSWQKTRGTLNGPYQDLPMTLNVTLWMPSMGLGSSPVKIKKVAPGEYEVSDVYFITSGKWEVKLQLLNAGKVYDEVILNYSL
jgi:hypothetical protein